VAGWRGTISLKHANCMQIAAYQTPEQATAIQQAALALIKAQSKLAETKAQASRLLDLYLSGDIAKPDYAERAQVLNDARAQLECQIVEIEAEGNQHGNVSLPTAAIWDSLVVGFCGGLRLVIHNFTFAERRRLLELAKTRLSVTAKETLISLVFGADLLKGVAITLDMASAPAPAPGAPTATGAAMTPAKVATLQNSQQTSYTYTLLI
jgi:hypothetical protein